MKWNMGPKAGKSPRVIGSIEAMPPHLSYIWVYSAVPSHHTKAILERIRVKSCLIYKYCPLYFDAKKASR